MGMSANVLSIQALEDLKAALARYGGEAQEALNAAQMEIRRTLNWLAERLHYWQNEVRRRQQLLAQAHAALARCRASGARDPKTGAYREPPCAAEWEAVRQAENYLRQAEAELRTVQHWKQAVEQAMADYGRQAGRLATQLSQELPRASALLERKIATLQSYVLMSAPATGAPPPVTSQTPSAASLASTVGQAIAAVPILTSMARPPGSPAVHGTQEILLGQIDLGDIYVKGSEDFHKVPHEAMIEGFHKLENVVRPAIQQGADGDYFSKMDAQQGLDYEHGYHRVYDAFYGGDAIALDKVGDRYQVINGLHRLFVAQELGLSTVPARIVGVVE